MLQASCIYLGLITPCPETVHPLHLPRRLITPCPTTNVISTKEYSQYPAWLMFPFLLPQTSLEIWRLPDPSWCSAWSLGRLSPLLAWIKVTYFCWGRLSFSASPEPSLTVPTQSVGGLGDSPALWLVLGSRIHLLLKGCQELLISLNCLFFFGTGQHLWEDWASLHPSFNTQIFPC